LDKVGLQKTDIIIAEPVGSCTDLSATLINPIKDMMKTEVSVSPLSVLADPKRLKDILEGGTSGLHPGAAYIYRKQLEESDIIVVTKSDLYKKEEIGNIINKLQSGFPECDIMALSAKTGEGVEEWLNVVLNREDSGKHIVEIDYDKYAEGEAVLGWLNCSASLSGNETDWDTFIRNLMNELALTFDAEQYSVGHVKIIVENGDQYISANLTGKSDTLTFRWSAGKSNEADMIVNARVEMSPEKLKQLFLQTLEKVTNSRIKTRINRIRSISPGYPNPTHRYKN